jgi:predicted transcriptional regulator
MYRSNLSFEGVTKYLAWLTSIGLLQKDPSTRKYQTTPKGEDLLSSWSETCKLLEIRKQNEAIGLIPRNHVPYSQLW